MTFVHTHVHSHFSIGDGICKPLELAERAKELGHKALALTDHGNACGLFEFWKECKDNNIKALCGIESYLAQSVKVEDEEGKVHKDTTYHCVLIAKNDQGYKDLCKLIYKSNSETFYYRPMILFDDLFSVNKGNIIASSACIGGILNRHFLSGNDEEAYKIAKRFVDFFGDDFYVELMLNNLKEQKLCNEKTIKLAQDLNVKIILTNDVHYIYEKQNKTHDVLKLITRKTTMDDVKNGTSENPFFTVRKSYMCDENDFHQFNKDFEFNYEKSFIDSCLENTNELADKCKFNFDIKSKKYPKIDFPKEYKNIEEYFTALCKEKLNEFIKVKKIDEARREIYSKQLDFEVEVINNAGYSDYFLIFYDLFKFVRENNIKTGPGRGSVGGSLIAFLLGITTVDPIKHNLQFVRFLNPTRISSPDIDCDFDSDRKSEIEKYLKEKYGENSVLHVATFNEFHMKGVLRDLVRVFNRDADLSNAVSKLIDDDLPEGFKTVTQYLRSLKYKEVYSFLEENEDILHHCDTLYGKLRFCGKHAAGTVVFQGPAYDHIPTLRLHGEILTGFREGTDKKQLSDLNILKLDLLGLDTVSIIKDTITLIKETKGIDVTEKIENVDLNDESLFKTINDYENSGIFQMESSGINKLCKAIEPKSFEDVVAISCLYRPGALQSGLAFSYADAKNDPEKKIDAGIFSKYLESTHGIIVYQEQLTECIADAFGDTLGKADLWRKPFSKGFKDEPSEDMHIDVDNIEREFTDRPKLKEFYNTFFDRIKNTHPELDKSQQYKTLKYLLGFVGYVFNRSHGLAYGVITMQCLFLKTYYPIEFYTVLLSRTDDEAKCKKYLLSAKNKGIRILPFSITKSLFNFSIEENGSAIRLGLKLIKGFGDKAYGELDRYRSIITTFRSFYEIEWKKLNKKCLLSLAQVGALDELGYNRKQTCEFTEKFIENAKAPKKSKVSFEDLLLSINNSQQNYSAREISSLFKENLGFDFSVITNKTFDKVKDFFKKNDIGGFSSWDEDKRVVGGFIENLTQKKTKNNKKYYELILNDGSISERIRVWPWALSRNNYDSMNTMSEGSVIIIELDRDDKYGFSNQKNGFLKVF